MQKKEKDGEKNGPGARRKEDEKSWQKVSEKEK
jgi:hypothetical protein